MLVCVNNLKNVKSLFLHVTYLAALDLVKYGITVNAYAPG